MRNFIWLVVEFTPVEISTLTHKPSDTGQRDNCEQSLPTVNCLTVLISEQQPQNNANREFVIEAKLN